MSMGKGFHTDLLTGRRRFGAAIRRGVLLVLLCAGIGILPAAAAENEPGADGQEWGQGMKPPGTEDIGPGSPGAALSLPASGCGPGSSKPPPHISPRLGIVISRARKKMESGENGEGARFLREYLGKHPGRDHVLLEFMLGNALYNADRSGEALQAYRKAVHLDPCYGPAWVNLGQVAMERENYPLAAEALSRGYVLSGSENPEYLYYAAVAHVLDGRHDRAAQLLEPLLSKQTGPLNLDWARTLLHAYMELGRNARARALLDRMLSSFPDDPEVWRYAYRFEANRQNYEKAAVALTVLSYLADLTREELLLLGDLYAAVHVPKEASDLYEAALRDGASAQEYERLAAAYLASHRPEEARRTLRRALQDRPSPKLWSLLGELYSMEEDYPAAFRAFRESARLDGEGGRAHLMMGHCALQMGRKQEAVAALKKAADHPRYRDTARQLLEEVRRTTFPASGPP